VARRRRVAETCARDFNSSDFQRFLVDCTVQRAMWSLRLWRRAAGGAWRGHAYEHATHHRLLCGVQRFDVSAVDEQVQWL